ncbi:MAG TPA: hypothetical protein VH144_02395 [Candidatus Saccharimonadales bacterium]|jgi:hypothetical protein|nr:hypothetical protein [Candidatus Saccharimonadales bacterium]
MKPDISSLLQKKMDRKDFLKHVGIGFVVLTGATTLIKTLNTLGAPSKQANGYGSSAYGGEKKS